MHTVTVRLEFIVRGWLTASDPRPEGEHRSRQFHAESTVERPGIDEYEHSADIDRVDETPDELNARYRDTTLTELLEFEVRTWEDETAAATCATGL